jgi:hypothetical protein
VPSWLLIYSNNNYNPHGFFFSSPSHLWFCCLIAFLVKTRKRNYILKLFGIFIELKKKNLYFISFQLMELFDF